MTDARRRAADSQQNTPDDTVGRANGAVCGRVQLVADKSAHLEVCVCVGGGLYGKQPAGGFGIKCSYASESGLPHLLYAATFRSMQL